MKIKAFLFALMFIFLISAVAVTASARTPDIMDGDLSGNESETELVFVPEIWRDGVFAVLFNDMNELTVALTFGLGNLLVAISAYLLGSLNSAIIISRLLYGKNIKKHGSGNAGMTNMFRVLGKRAGILTFLGDVAKAAISVLLGRLILGDYGTYIAGIFCVLGHVAPIFYKFKGGKGVLVTAVTIALTNFTLFLIVIGIFLVTVLISRYVSLGSVLAAFIYPGLVKFYMDYSTGAPPPAVMMIFAFFAGLMIIYLHRDNLKRIYAGTESKVDLPFLKKKNIDE